MHFCRFFHSGPPLQVSTGGTVLSFKSGRVVDRLSGHPYTCQKAISCLIKDLSYRKCFYKLCVLTIWGVHSIIMPPPHSASKRHQLVDPFNIMRKWVCWSWGCMRHHESSWSAGTKKRPSRQSTDQMPASGIHPHIQTHNSSLTVPHLSTHRYPRSTVVKDGWIPVREVLPWFLW